MLSKMLKILYILLYIGTMITQEFQRTHSKSNRFSFSKIDKYCEENIHYDPLMMSQKEAPRKHPCVLPRKVAYLV